jgi:hypothetical protein
MNRICLVLVVAGLTLALFCPPSLAQIAVLQGQGTAKQTVQISGQFDDPPSSSKEVYTVPNNRRFRITDILFTNYSNEPCDVRVQGKTYEIRIPPSSTFATNLLSGPTFLPGEKVTLGNTWRLPGHGASCRPIYTIMGYLYTVP